MAQLLMGLSDGVGAFPSPEGLPAGGSCPEQVTSALVLLQAPLLNALDLAI